MGMKALLPRFPNYSQLSTLAHSLAPCLSARRVRPSRGRSSPRPSVSRSVQTDALRETESIGRRTRAAFPSGERAGSRRPRRSTEGGVDGGGGAPNGLRYVRALFQESGRRGLARSRRSQIKPVLLLLINVCVPPRSRENPRAHNTGRIRGRRQFVGGKVVLIKSLTHLPPLRGVFFPPPALVSWRAE